MSRHDLRDEDRETQISEMENWFREHYEDPAERTPYESKEGGYLWIYGGPFDAREELECEFGGDVPDDVIDELVNTLEGECFEWAPTSGPEDYEEYVVEDIVQITDYHENFLGSLDKIKSLCTLEVSGLLSGYYLRILYANVITALETYLSDTFIGVVSKDKALMRAFFEKNDQFMKEKILLSDVFRVVDEAETRFNEHVLNIAWHNIGRVESMYSKILGVEFQKEEGKIRAAVVKRHDIVHRNGKTKDGEEVVVSKEDIDGLIEMTRSFVSFIDAQVDVVIESCSM